MHPAALPDDELLKECVLTRGRTSGPGGQHRNKVATAVELVHKPTGIAAHAGERREPSVNMRVALRRLRLALAVEHRTPPRKTHGFEEIASELWRSRRRDKQLSVSERSKDLPAILAEAFDILSDSRWDPRKAGLRLGVSASQLIKLAKKHPPALAYWNEQRKRRGQGALQ